MSDAPNRIKKLARFERRRDNIERRLDQLDKDFEAANDLEAELRINEEIRVQHMLLARVERRLAHG